MVDEGYGAGEEHVEGDDRRAATTISSAIDV